MLKQESKNDENQKITWNWEIKKKLFPEMLKMKGDDYGNFLEGGINWINEFMVFGLAIWPNYNGYVDLSLCAYIADSNIFDIKLLCDITIDALNIKTNKNNIVIKSNKNDIYFNKLIVFDKLKNILNNNELKEIVININVIIYNNINIKYFNNLKNHNKYNIKYQINKKQLKKFKNIKNNMQFDSTNKSSQISNI